MVTISIFIVVQQSVLVKIKNSKGGKNLNNKFTDFGLKVKIELLKQSKDQKWLEEEVTKRTDLYLDSRYIYKILTGQSPPKKSSQQSMKFLS